MRRIVEQGDAAVSDSTIYGIAGSPYVRGALMVGLPEERV